MDLKLKVQQLKSSFSVEGSPLIKSNRFVQESFDELKKERKDTHPSHFSHLSKNSKVWSDEEISEQIRTMLEQKTYSKNDLNDFASDIFFSLKFENYNDDLKSYKNQLISLLGWKNLTPLDSNFWKNFGSAPFVVNDGSSSMLKKMKEKYGACGMNEIFDNKFSDGYQNVHFIGNQLHNFKIKWAEEVELRKEKAIVFTSPFCSLEDIQENVTIKNSKIEGRNFYMDKTKDFTERCKVFETFGEVGPWIHQPKNKGLAKIFKMYNEMDYANRYEQVYCSNIIEFWVEELSENRLSLDWRNSYHPELVRKKRNYNPSEEAIQRLQQYCMELLFLEGISEFKMDW